MRTPGRHDASVTWTVSADALVPSVVVNVTVFGLTDSIRCPPGGSVTVYVTGIEVRLPFEPSNGMLAV